MHLVFVENINPPFPVYFTTSSPDLGVRLFQTVHPWSEAKNFGLFQGLQLVFFGSDDELDVVEVTGPQPQSQTMLITKPMLPDVPEATLPAAHGTAASRIALDLGKAFGIATDNFFVQVEVQHRGVLAQARSDRMSAEDMWMYYKSAKAIMIIVPDHTNDLDNVTAPGQDRQEFLHEDIREMLVQDIDNSVGEGIRDVLDKDVEDISNSSVGQLSDRESTSDASSSLSEVPN